MRAKNISILGAGAFGTALAFTCHRAGHSVTLLCKDEEQAQEINKFRTNTRYASDKLIFPENVNATTDLGLLNEADAVVIALPAQVLDDVLGVLSTRISPKTPLVLCSKGIVDALPLPHFPINIAKKYFSGPLGILSGPNFASELAEGLPAAAALALDPSVSNSEDFIQLFNHPTFRIYPTTDMIGVGVAGAVKNILAIGCGMIAGKYLGSNAAAAFLTRGLTEMTRLGLAIHAKKTTFFGLAGIGDLTLTCSSPKSRNYRFGFRLGQGEEIGTILNEELCEGYHSLTPVLKLAGHHGVEMPLCQAIKSVVGGESIDVIVESLFSRPTCDSEFLEMDACTGF